MNFRLFLLIVLLAWGTISAASQQPVNAELVQENAIGEHADYLKEENTRLSLDDALVTYGAGKFKPGASRSLNFGIGSAPVWIHFSVNNPTAAPLPRVLSIETAWLDNVEVYMRYQGRTVAADQMGDSQAFEQRPVESRFFVVDHDFNPGTTDIFIRAATPDPMVMPVFLLTPDQARTREQQQDYSYGFLYGYLLALLAFNAILFASLRNPRYILYSLYLLMFLVTNISYTGHGSHWLWPGNTTWAQWSNPTMMVLYGISGLLFALSFLDTRKHLPRIYNAVLWSCAMAFLLLVVCVFFGSQKGALLVAFSFVLLFSIMMLALGTISVRAGQKAARYFLLAAVSAMVGASITALAVWGFIPHNIWTFRAVDIGMIMDATLLALALAYQFRTSQEDKLRAEKLATLDHLTGINNRRAFYDKANPIWHMSLRHNRNLSVILLDLDHFKQLNDAYGHATGDEVLIITSTILMNSIRGEDILARWGGEEFILLLPEANLLEATALAERLRAAIGDIRIKHGEEDITFTASFGVAQRDLLHPALDSLISSADKLLYQSKKLGRNRVCTQRVEVIS